MTGPVTAVAGILLMLAALAWMVSPLARATLRRRTPALVLCGLTLWLALAALDRAGAGG